MHLIETDDYTGISRVAADLIAAVIRDKPTATILVATGNTPMGAYDELATMRTQENLDTSRLRPIQLDEYLGIPIDDRRSLYGWMLRSFVDPLEIPHTNVIRLPGDTPDPAAACHTYDAAVRATGQVDLAVLGLGPNGHLGFNEPPVEPTAPTRVVTLTEESIESNARYWGGRDQVPHHALTAGMTVLLAVRQTLLLVSGAHKHEILDRTLHGPITPDVPASYLQRARDVTVVADRAAVRAK